MWERIRSGRRIDGGRLHGGGLDLDLDLGLDQRGGLERVHERIVRERIVRERRRLGHELRLRAESGSESGSSARVPGDVLDLAAWKLTLPIEDPREAGSPWEILQPELATFSIDPYFMLDASGEAVIFHAHAGGTTTDNSGYPRSELREMTADGAELASWSTSEGTHTMTIVQAITALPEVKPHVVAGQVHDAEDDVVMIRLEDEHLFVEGGGDELGTLDDAYVLGTEFTVVVAAHDGEIDVYYEDLATPVVTVPRDVDGCYFKAGAYTQSNEEQGDAPDAYGEVVIRELTVEHEP